MDKRESQMRILTADGGLLERRIATTPERLTALARRAPPTSLICYLDSALGAPFPDLVQL